MTSTKEMINQYVRVKVEKLVANYLKKLPPKIKKELKDPYMCACVKSLIDDLVDNIWPDVEEEILYQLRMKLSQPYLKPEEPPKYGWFCCCCLKFRACFRYNYYPVDRSSWRQYRNFWWWCITLITMIPYFAVMPIFKLFVFVMIDKRDEYQLISYILDFKTMMFVTMGCVGGITGYIQYVRCLVTDNGRTKSGIEVNECAVQGNLDDFFYILEVDFKI